jgi:23S rRNA (cytosine1962-C5)-methyltransferase
MSDILTLALGKNRERRLRAGHLWIYANEIDTRDVALADLPAGAECVVTDSKGHALGRGFVSPHSLIAVRLFSRSGEQAFNHRFVMDRLEEAQALRRAHFEHDCSPVQDCYRLVYGEADGLPGLVVDRFADTLVVQTGTWGMEQQLPLLVDALAKVTSARHIVLKNDAGLREQEGLPLYVRAAVGEVPETLAIKENGLNFTAPLVAGQKTGWFYDHREARARLYGLVREASVLDVFSYCGAWGVGAAARGATSVTCVDSSRAALDQVVENAVIQKVADRVTCRNGDARKVMKALLEEGAKFDVIVLDPPAFIKRKKDFKQGLNGYYQINELALRLVRPGGLLVSASCSMHLPAGQLLDLVQGAARHVDRRLQVTGFVGQAADHPVHPAIPETAYLKSWFLRVLKNV